MLITHWGMSGPHPQALGVGRLRVGRPVSSSPSQLARLPNESEVAALLNAHPARHPEEESGERMSFELPKVWAHLLHKAGLDPDMPWHDVVKARNKLLNTLLNDVYAVRGKPPSRRSS